MLRTSPTAVRSAIEIPSIVGEDGLLFRRVETLDEYHECVAIQEEIWGDNFRERVPTAILMVAQKMSGVCAAAFTPAGRQLGFVFGVTGIRHGELAHWSDLLAVRADARGAHIGERLKRYQRELCLAVGVNTIYWTFDPLVARNAHLNLVRLGARASEYVVNMYGSNTGSPLHGGIETDRWVAAWDLTAPTPATIPHPAPPRADGVFVVRSSANGTEPVITGLIDAPVVRVAIPVDQEQLPLAKRRAWRDATRRAFLHYLEQGGEVISFQRASGGLPPFYEIAMPTGTSGSSSSLHS